VWRGREEGRGAEEVLDCGPLGGRAKDGPPEGRGFATRADEERRFDFALEPVSGAAQNFPAPPASRPFESAPLRGFRRETTSDGCAEELGQAGEGRGLDSELEAPLSTTDGPTPDALEAAFLAGAAFAALDPIVRTEALWRGAWSSRLALSAASASARLLGRGEDEAALRDAFALRRPGDDPGPAGRLLAAWRGAAGRRPYLVFDHDTAERIALDLGLPRGGAVLSSVEDAEALARSDRPAIFAAAETAAQTFRRLGQSHGREAEILALLLADAVLACRLRWPVCVPLLAGVAFDPALRRAPEGKRPRPDDPDWPRICCLGYARAAAAAHDLARDLARRAVKLEAVMPSLRTKGIEAAVGKILSDDVVAAPMRPGNLSERSARRLLDRLVSLGALRELTGRPTFRLYGL
jgi:hypothetical protein